MSDPGRHWFHITFGTHGSWLPGDPRGFRSRDEKIHSSGDHRHPPPPGEHRGLHLYSKQHSPDAVRIPNHMLVVIGTTIIKHARLLEYRTNAVSVSPMHVHLLIELPCDGTTACVGRIKRRASVAVTEELPGKIWESGCGVKRIRDRSHQVNTYRYIVKHGVTGAWVWGCTEG